MSGRSPSAQPETPALRAPHVRDDTIVAISTAPGLGAIAIVRVSGALTGRTCRRVVSPQNEWPLRAREATRCWIHAVDDTTTVLDEGLVTYFPAPHSYTGEDVVEISTHGGVYVPLAVCAALVEAGARTAEPGEFTERAVLNGKFDLIRAEAVADLIESRSRAAHRTAIRQLSGALSARLAELRNGLIEIEALLAFDIDFPEEDDGHLSRGRVTSAAELLIARLDALLATIPMAELGREGATVVLAGEPNAGKSSLLNALVGEARVIVSATPGTTRDAVEVLLDHDPWPIRLVDTAGLRDSDDPVERLGVEVSERYLTRAHVVVACAPSAVALAQTVSAIRDKTHAPIVGAYTKADLSPNGEGVRAAAYPVVRVSALAGTGLQELLACVTNAIVGAVDGVDPETPMITRARHRTALSRARAELVAFRGAWTAAALPTPVVAVHVRAAGAALDDLIGVIDIDDVFARVFSTFCVGK
jgi:tRNA modification GTPase